MSSCFIEIFENANISDFASKYPESIQSICDFRFIVKINIGKLGLLCVR